MSVMAEEVYFKISKAWFDGMTHVEVTSAYWQLERKNTVMEQHVDKTWAKCVCVIISVYVLFEQEYRCVCICACVLISCTLILLSETVQKGGHL